MRWVAVLGRSSKGIQAVARLDLARDLGVRATLQHRADRAAAERWAPAARRALYGALWGEAAREVGAERRQLADDFVLLSKGDRHTIAWFHHVQLDDPVTLRLALDKRLVHEVLQTAGLPVPEHREYTPADPSAALALLDSSCGPFVVKPASGTSGGWGVTCAVDSVADFRRATLHASRWGERLIIERAVVGDEYRFLFLDGELLDVVRRTPAHVVGDGRLSIADLISRENRTRQEGGPRASISVLDVNLDCVLTLDRAGLRLGSTVPEGVEVQVRSTASANGPRDNVTVDRASIAATLVDEARRAADAVHLRLAGVDLVMPDLTRSLAQAGGAILEVNGTPGFHYHYLVAEPDRATPVVVPVLRTLLGEAIPGRSAKRPPPGRD